MYMKSLFVILLIFHGAIHSLGFLKAFHFAKIEQLIQTISKPIGLLWLLATVLFFITVLLFLYKHDSWPVIAIIAVIISQMIVVLSWQDAKFGTIANVIILLVSIQGFAEVQFVKMTKQESLHLIQNGKAVSSEIITEAAISSLPPIVQQWMRFSGVIGTTEAVSVRLQQTGEMRTKPEQSWMPFTAEQYIDVANPSFVWTTSAKMMPLVSFRGRDKLENGEGAMLIKVASLIPVVNEKANEKINSGAMLRFLGEMCWYPSAALSEYIEWEQLDSSSARATLSINGSSVTGTFTFSQEGELISFEANRFYGADDAATLEKWYIEPVEFKVFQDVKIPYKCKVTWKLDAGDFTWLTLELTDLAYNELQLFKP